jgi:hypothetical protein
MNTRAHLEASVNALRGEIAALDLGDQDARQRLEGLVQDIERSLANPRLGGTDQDLGDRLKASILRFEASHPRLAALMNDVTQQLGNMGI